MKIKISDLIVNKLVKLGLEDVFCISGGAAAHLMESVRNSNLNVIHPHHEQAAAMAADGYARIKNKPALLLVTNGPGVSNTITGILGAYQDSIPMIILSGQVPLKHSIDANNIDIRQLGIQESSTRNLVNGIVKDFIQVKNPKNVTEIIEESWRLATTGRKGPVWIEVPLDIQAMLVEDFEELVLSNKTFEFNESDTLPDNIFFLIMNQLKTSKKPIVILGNGVRLSGINHHMMKLIEVLKVPVITSWNTSDLFPFDHELYIGNFGILGQRWSNIAVQNSDFILIFGCRLSIPQIGHQTELFSPNSYKVMVDIDIVELNKPTLKIDLKVCSDLNNFVIKFIEFLDERKSINNSSFDERIKLISAWKNRFIDKDKDKNFKKNCINAYRFIDILGDYIPDNSVIVTDMGISFTCTMQNLKNNGKNRLFTSSGTSSMGYGLPGAIGAYIANKSNVVICISGDGGFQMNIQELQTVVHNKIPLKLFILDSNGYLAISTMQDNLFQGKYFGSTPQSGVSSPNFKDILNAYKLKSIVLNDEHELKTVLEKGCLLSSNFESFILTLPNTQLMSPRVKGQKDKTGQITSGSIESMWPFLSPEESKKIDEELLKLENID